MARATTDTGVEVVQNVLQEPQLKWHRSWANRWPRQNVVADLDREPPGVEMSSKDVAEAPEVTVEHQGPQERGIREACAPQTCRFLQGPVPPGTFRQAPVPVGPSQDSLILEPIASLAGGDIAPLASAPVTRSSADSESCQDQDGPSLIV